MSLIVAPKKKNPLLSYQGFNCVVLWLSF